MIWEAIFLHKTIVKEKAEAIRDAKKEKIPNSLAIVSFKEKGNKSVVYPERKEIKKVFEVVLTDEEETQEELDLLAEFLNFCRTNSIEEVWIQLAK